LVSFLSVAVLSVAFLSCGVFIRGFFVRGFCRWRFYPITRKKEKYATNVYFW